MPELEECSGYTYLRETAYDRKTIKQMLRPAIAEVDTFKKYPKAPQVELPTNWKLNEARITPLIQNRRSLRKYSEEEISFEELAFMLWSCQGITAKSGNYTFRSVPSGGALYPVETYLFVNNVEGLAPGLYHYDVEGFSLDILREEDIKSEMVSGFLDQKFMANAGVVFVWTAVMRRCMSKYGNRGMRYIFLDAGHVCGNLLLAAEATTCGGCPVAAFYDDELNTTLGIDSKEETIIYAASVGKKIITKKQCKL
jgi:SagB-type dehydrogenase family enzyme